MEKMVKNSILKNDFLIQETDSKHKCDSKQIILNKFLYI